METENQKKMKALFAFSWRELLITLLIMGGTAAFAFILHSIDASDAYVPMLFIMAVFMVSRYTDGYLLGILSSVAGVILVNYIFTYPYFAFDFTISGYPITFLCMLATSVMTSTMTTHIKQQEKIRAVAEKEKIRGNLLRAVSHDLRTPLTSIWGTTSALLENDDKLSRQQQQELLQECHDDAEWLIRMVENLLSITRMSGTEAKIQKTPEAVEEIIGETICKFYKHFPTSWVTVAVPEELLIVPMDAILIEQVLFNLLENAVMHGKPPGEIQLCVTKTQTKAVFTVRDHGVGLSEDVRKHLFDGYLAGREKGLSDSKRNMGIGLSVCMSIIKLHGGEMTAENNPEGGAVFRFTLPLEEES